MELTQNLLERPGFNLHYWTGGKAGAPLVVFTHGATVDHHEWDATLPLVGENFRFLAWDVRGHGLSRPVTFEFKEAIDDLLAILDQLHIEQAISLVIRWAGTCTRNWCFTIPSESRPWFSWIAPGISRSFRPWKPSACAWQGRFSRYIPIKCW